MKHLKRPQQTDLLMIIALTLIAFALRVWRLDSVPPGMRVDELSNTFVVSQHVLDGNYRFFFPDASGHEGLWHALQAAFIALFGYTPFGMRGASVVLGTLTIPLTWLVGRELYDRRVGLLAAVGMTATFWSLLYSRVATRHISTLPFLLLGFYFTYKALTKSRRLSPSPLGEGRGEGSSYRRHFIPAGLSLGLTLHTYFAGWVVVAVTGAFIVFLALFSRQTIKGKWSGIGLMTILIALLALPVLRDMRNMPAVEEEGRINVVAAPLHAAREGDFSQVIDHVVKTFGMYVNYGDPEWLYNVPERPVFGWVLVPVFWIGVVMMLWSVMGGIFGRNAKPSTNSPSSNHIPATFLLFWWVAGLSPAFISVPPASLGHTLAAQPATYILLALPLAWLSRQIEKRLNGGFLCNAILPLMMLALLATISLRDLQSYFVEWPSRGFVRFLYHGEIHDVGDWLQTNDLRDFGISGQLIEPWEAVALDLYAPEEMRPRWFNPDRALLLETAGEPAANFAGYPNEEGVFDGWYSAETPHPVGNYKLKLADTTNIPKANDRCFQNGLCIDQITYDTPTLDIVWRAASAVDVPARKITSFPPIPGDYGGPRLLAFTHLWNANGDRLTGDDGWWVDPETLQADDRFIQRHILIPPDASATQIAIGLYDPMTGQRILTDSGEDHFAVPLK